MVGGRGTDDHARPSGLSVLLHNRGLILLALVMMLFHFGNAPMSRLIAQEFSIQLGTPFRTTALITGVAQATMIAVAAATPWLIRRLGLRSCFLIALCALPLRGVLAGMVPDFWVVVPVQMLDGIGAGMLGILTPVAAERLLAETGRFNLGFATVMTVQGVGATFSNVFAAGSCLATAMACPISSARAWPLRPWRCSCSSAGPSRRDPVRGLTGQGDGLMR